MTPRKRVKIQFFIADLVGVAVVSFVLGAFVMFIWVGVR